MRPIILQLCVLMPAIQQRLDEAFDVRRIAPAKIDAAWLAENGAGVRGVVTAGDIGIENALARELPDLGIVAINGVGYDRVDLQFARERGFKVTNTPDVLTDDVADVAIGLMLNVLRNFVGGDSHVRQGHWQNGPLPLARKASGRRYGIAGLGRIGQAIASRLAGFNGRIAYTSRNPKPVGYQYLPDLESLAAASDVLFIAAAATPETRGLVDAAVLRALGPDGIIINVSRGSVIDEPALVHALSSGAIAGAGLDVFAKEPHVPPELLALPNVVLTPHVGSATHETRTAMGNLMIDNLAAFFANAPLPSEVI